MKVCKKCKVDLIIGDNIFNSRAKNYDWICKSCVSKGIKVYHDSRYNKMRNGETAGVYDIYKGDQIIYIGESIYPSYRINTHFTSKCKKNSSLYLIMGKHNKHLFRWEMLGYEDIEVERKIMESFYIDRYKPPFNYPYNMFDI